MDEYLLAKLHLLAAASQDEPEDVMETKRVQMIMDEYHDYDPSGGGGTDEDALAEMLQLSDDEVGELFAAMVMEAAKRAAVGTLARKTSNPVLEALGAGIVVGIEMCLARQRIVST